MTKDGVEEAKNDDIEPVFLSHSRLSIKHESHHEEHSSLKQRSLTEYTYSGRERKSCKKCGEINPFFRNECSKCKFKFPKT